MSDVRKLESLTLDKMIGRLYELEDDNARMRPVVNAALAMLVGDIASVNDSSCEYAALIAEARKFAAESKEPA